MMKRLFLALTLLSFPVFAFAQTQYLGEFDDTDTIRVLFSTYDSNGGSVTITGLATTDIEIYKDGSITQRSSDNGFSLIDTDGIDIDSTTGLHGFSIDLSDNSDSGFYAAGSQYTIVLNEITVDTQTVRPSWYFKINSAGWEDLKDGTDSLLSNWTSGALISGSVATGSTAGVVNATTSIASNDMLIDFTICVTDSSTAPTELDCAEVEDFTQGTPDVFDLKENLTFTPALNDEFFVYPPNMNVTIKDTFTDTNNMNGTNGAVLDDDSITATVIAADAIGGDEIAENAISQSELANNAIGADQIATDAIGSSELAANAITASELATDSISAGTLAANTIGASELGADAVDEIWDEVIETAGSTYTGRCLLAALGAYAAGEVNTVGNTSTYQDTGGNVTRIVGTINASGRGTMSITCP